MTLNNDQWQEAIVQLANSGLSSASAGITGNGVPASADYVGFNSGGTLVGVSSSNPLPVAAQHASMVDATNSSTTLLTANSIFTGTWQSSLNYSALSVQAFADQASAASGLQVQQSQDGVNADTSDNFSVSASTNFQTTVNLTGKFYRVKYTNGGTNQGTFRLQTIAQTSEVVMPRTLDASGNLKVAVQGTVPVSGTFWQATQPVSGTFWQATQPVSLAGNQATNTAQVAGTTTSVANGTTDAGTQRVTLSSDSTGQVKLAAGSNTIGALTANQSVNVAQYGGQNPTLDNTTIPAFSMRGKGSVAGDTALLLESQSGIAGVSITEDSVRNLTLLGKAYIATTGLLSSPGTATLAMQFFNPASGTKNILIYRILITAVTSGLTWDIRKTSADVSSITGWSNTAVTPVNKGASAAASTVTCGYSNVNLTGGLLGTAIAAISGGAAALDVLTNGSCIWLPASAASIAGVVLYINETATTKWGATIEYLEF